MYKGKVINNTNWELVLYFRCYQAKTKDKGHGEWRRYKHEQDNQLKHVSMAHKYSNKNWIQRHKLSSKQTFIQVNKRSQQFLTKKDGHKDIRQKKSTA